MDFKVAGTRGGITALQMDLKISGINEQIMQAALQQAHEGRQHILEKMEEVLAQPRKEASQYAPRMLRLKIPVDKIRDIIGKGGSVIKNLQETTSTRIDVEDNGIVTICGKNSASCESAKSKIEGLTSDLEMGRIYEGKVEKHLRKRWRRHQCFTRTRRPVTHIANFRPAHQQSIRPLANRANRARQSAKK